MKNEPPLKPSASHLRRSLEERLANRPDLLDRLHAIVDTLEKSVVEECDAHDAEDRVVDEVRKLGQTMLGQWAKEANAQIQGKVPTQHPEAIKNGKKKLLKWLTTFGWVSVEEEQWRLGRRGKVLRPFSVATGVTPQGSSRRMQRAIVDFGAEESFAKAATSVREHYGVDVSVGRVRQHTLEHGTQMGGLTVPTPKDKAGTVVSQMDGSMIPIVEPNAESADQRKGKELAWREVRLCLAREKESATPVYGTTFGCSVGIAGQLWHEVAVAAGLGPNTRVHGVGDGADWIIGQFQEQFGSQGAYLLDFWHVSDYLGNAATVIAPQATASWRHDQQDRLLENDSASVLRVLAPHLEPEDQKESPVRAAHRYLSERSDQLDYAGARAAGLPIGSGEVEGGHGHVIQDRLKLTGCWWRSTNAHSILNLRVARANRLWDSYWKLSNADLN